MSDRARFDGRPHLILLLPLAAAQEVELSGRAESHVRLGLDGCTPALAGDCAWLDFHDAVVVGVKGEARFSRVVSSEVAVDLRLHGPPSLGEWSDTSEPTALLRGSPKLQRAVVDLRGDTLALVLGADKAQWGVAEGISVIDVVNPWDLEDPTRFDRRLAVPMVRLQWVAGRMVGELIGVPWFRPALMPPAGVDLLASADDGLGDIGAAEVEVGDLEVRPDYPEPNLANASGGVRLLFFTKPFDLALSAWTGRDSLPQLGGTLLVTGFQTDSDRVDLGIPVLYPRMSQVGLELRTELPGEIGAWAEVAGVKPSPVELTFSSAQLSALARLGTIEEVPDPIPVTVIQDGRPFVRAVLGAERTFGPVYVQAQWLHGFPTERRRGELQDYALLGLRSNLRPTVALDASGMVTAGAWLAGGGISWLVADAAELRLGALWVSGAPGSALEAFEGVSNVGLHSSVTF